MLAIATTTIAVGLIIGIGFSFLATLIHVVFSHSRGTALYLTKTVIISLIAIPFCILLVVGALFYAGYCVWSVVKNWLNRIYKSNSPEKADELEGLCADDVVVHLVHGTFEQKAAWTLKNSPMWREIQQQNPSVKLTRFEWTGANTQSARRSAAEKFGKELCNSESNNHYIVAHSHAGNIIQELSQCVPQAAYKVKGVCLLSTPFIYMKMLERTGGQLTLLHSIGFATFVEMIVAAGLWHWNLNNVVTASLVFLLAVALDHFMTKRCSTQLTEEMSRRNDQVDLRNVQIMHAIGDEADSGLRFVSTLHEACFGILSQLAAADKLLRQKINRPYMICYVLLLLAAGVIFWRVSEPIFWLISILVGFIWVAFSQWFDFRHKSKEVSLLLVMAGLPVAIVAFYLNIMKSIAYGDWRLVFCPNMFIYSSETPSGDHRILKYAPSSDGALVHSTHSHKSAIRDVAAWIWYELDEAAKPRQAIPDLDDAL
ncbi:hypothetical protein [Chromobacterium piscinae]|uniref:hypothetical protein n=1 Tax=Chromobacterium piscinae TaxID=686831 RepID=UPI003F80BCEA